MPAYHDRKQLPYTPEQLFALVADVEKYPEFLPWCCAARIIERDAGGFLAELSVNFKGFSERYTSRVTLSPPYGIEVAQVSGPFEYLENHWKFEPAEGGAVLDFGLDFRFRSRLLEGMMGGLFTRAQGKMMEAFEERAKALYGG